VISFDKNFSVELCGGTHVSNTAHIGYFKIITESSIATGVRRIEAFSGLRARNWLNDQLVTFNQLKEVFKNPKDIIAQANKLLEENNQIKKQLLALETEKATILTSSLSQSWAEKGIAQVISEVLAVNNPEMLKTIASNLRRQPVNAFV